MTKPEFSDYYVTETNRRLEAIEKDLRALLQLRSQILALTFISSGVISTALTSVITYFFKLKTG